MDQELQFLEKIMPNLLQLNPDINILMVFFLLLCRLVPFIYLSFFMGARMVPMPVKVFMAIGLFSFMLPTIFLNATNLSFNYLVLAYGFKELFVGLILGIMVSIPNYIVMISGMVIDHQRGAASLMISNPILSIQDSPLGVLFSYLLIYFYWLALVPFVFFEAMAESYHVIPIDRFLPVAVFNFDSHVYSTLQNLFSRMFAMGIQLAAPSLVTIVIIDMFLGITNRLAPQVMISFLAQGLKAMLGLSVLYYGWYYIMNIFLNQGKEWGEFFLNWVRGFPY